MDPLRLPPILAGTIVWVLVFLGATVGGLAASLIVRVAGNMIIVLVIIGWPAMLVERLSPRVKGRLRPNVFRAAVLATLVFHAVLAPSIFLSEQGAEASGAIGTIVIALSGFMAPLYVLWSAARVLVSLENNASPSWDRCIGTFLLLFFLPLGIFFLQARVRRIASRGVV